MRARDRIRDGNGLCIYVKPGEVGQIVGKVRNDVLSRFEGYTHEAESKRKLIPNVFAHGDLAFLSGDLMRVDKYGWCYFERRTGDTYRWKGENISTVTIESAVQRVIRNQFVVCAVGVKLSAYDGEAGLLSLNTTVNDVKMETIELAMEPLPKYTRPVFLRLTRHMPLTPTLKIKKFELKQRGINGFEDDTVFVNIGGNFQLLDVDLRKKLDDGSLRL